MSTLTVTECRTYGMHPSSVVLVCLAVFKNNQYIRQNANDQARYNTDCRYYYNTIHDCIELFVVHSVSWKVFSLITLCVMFVADPAYTQGDTDSKSLLCHTQSRTCVPPFYSCIHACLYRQSYSYHYMALIRTLNTSPFHGLRFQTCLYSLPSVGSKASITLTRKTVFLF